MSRRSDFKSPGRKPGGSPHTELVGEIVVVDGDPQIYLISNKTYGPQKNVRPDGDKNVRKQRP